MPSSQSHPTLRWSPRTEQILDDFEVAWKSGPPCIGEFADRAADEERQGVLVELIKIDLEQRWKQGDSADIARLETRDYQQQHPELTDADVQEVAVDEYRVRLRWGDRPQLEEFTQAYALAVDEFQARLRRVQDDVNTEFDYVFHQDTQLGDFRILGEIGRGGMGVVYEAEQISLRRRVAIKVLHASAAGDEHRRNRFHHEIQAVAMLRHDHVVPVFAVGEQDGHHFYVMQLIQGFPLSKIQAHAKSLDLVTRSMPRQADDTEQPTGRVGSGETDRNASLHQLASQIYSEGEDRARMRHIAGLIESVARTLHYVHENGVVHRDIKPSNLLLDMDGKVWVTDFGLAQLDSESTITTSGEILGTLQYMSPEQTLGRRDMIDGRTDVYSLGVLMYLLMTGELPFRGQPRMIIKQSINDDPVSPRELNHRIAVDLETICLKCLQKEPGSRYATAEELADDLQRYQQGEPIPRRSGTGFPVLSVDI